MQSLKDTKSLKRTLTESLVHICPVFCPTGRFGIAAANRKASATRGAKGAGWIHNALNDIS